MENYAIIIYIICGLIMGIPVIIAFPLCDFICKVDADDFSCKECIYKNDCMGMKNIFKDSNWLFEFTLISYLFVEKKCSYANYRINIFHYICTLVSNCILYIIIYINCGMSIESALFCLCGSVLLCLSIIDGCTKYIPVEFNIILFILGLIRLYIHIDVWFEYVIGLVVVSGFLFLVNLIVSRIMKIDSVIGGGDIKLMAAAGLLLGWKLIILALMIGCVLGALIHLILMATKKGNHVLAFGPYLSMGIFIAMIWGQQLVSWYLSMAGFNVPAIINY